jgi:hypothetical protein
MSLLDAQKNIILSALDDGAERTAQYLMKLTQKPWECAVSSFHQDFSLDVVLASPQANADSWSAYVPLRGETSFGVQLLIDATSIASISTAFSGVWSAMGMSEKLSPKDMIREVSNIVAHGFCGEIGKISGALLILSIPEVMQGQRGRLLEDGIKRVPGANLIVISHIVMSSSSHFSIRCELYFYSTSKFMKSLLPSDQLKQ